MAAQLASSYPKLIQALQDNPQAEAELDTLLKQQQEKFQQEMQRQLLHLQATIAKLEEEKRLARAERFAASSEQIAQYALFDEAEASLNEDSESTEVDEMDSTIAVPSHTRQGPKRKPLPQDLPRVVIEHDLEDKACDCGADKVRIGTKTSEQLDVIPAQVYVIEHRRHSYKCPCCEDAVPETATMPVQPIPKSVASPGLLAQVAVSKYDDGLPLYRQSSMFARMGVDLPRQTLASHMVKAGEQVQPLINRFARHARDYDVLQMDETRVQVLDEDGRAARSQSWMWVIRGGPAHQPIIRFDYDPSRAGSVATKLLAGYQGYLQTDGYRAYRQVLDTPGVTGLGCWAHVRRKFVKAIQAAPKGKSGKAQQILSWIGKLYALEKQWQRLPPEERQAQREANSTPVLNQIETWLSKQNVNPQSLLGKAISYLQSEWPRLIVYLEDGRLNLDNNPVENAIRPFALGRKNWLFSQSVAGAQASAALYSLIETATANGLNTYTYLKHVFTVLPGLTREEDLDALMPWNVDRKMLEQYQAPIQTT